MNASEQPERAKGSRWRGIRWLLSVAAILCLTAWFLGGWGRVGYAWPTGRVSLGPRGLTFAASLSRSTDPIGWWADWRSGAPEWYYAVWWRWVGDSISVGCSLLPPGIVAGALAAWLWIRTRRPARAQTLTRNLRRQGVVRWVFTGVSLAILAVFASGFRYSTSCRVGSHTITIDHGLYEWSRDSNAGPTANTFSTSRSVRQPAPDYYILFEWLNLGSVATFQIRLWLVLAMAAVPTALLWYIRLRRYADDGRCPICLYDRVGIPAASPCPECGTVDDRARGNGTSPA